MPLRDYVCKTCGERVELLVGQNEKEPEKCEACGTGHPDGLQRDEDLAAPGAIVFGPGFFKTGGY